MKTILLGYPDEAGKEKARLLSGPDVPVSETNKRLASVKAGTWPHGIVRVEQWSDERGRVNLAIKLPVSVEPAPHPSPAPVPVASINAEKS